MDSIKIKGTLHRDGYGIIRLSCPIPDEAFPQIIQGSDDLHEAIVEITLTGKRK